MHVGHAAAPPTLLTQQSRDTGDANKKGASGLLTATTGDGSRKSSVHRGEDARDACAGDAKKNSR